jgi:peroxiredoxin Q/BCP
LTTRSNCPAVLKTGDAAADFVLKDTEGRDVRLSGIGGAIVLYFYPRDGTPGCTLEAKRFRDNYDEIVSQGATVVGVSMDDVESHHDFSERCDLPYPLLSDPDGRVHDLYGAWLTRLAGRRQMAARRCTFLIDQNGIIRHVYKRVNPLTHVRQVVEELQRLKAQGDWGKGTQSEPKLKELLKP